MGKAETGERNCRRGLGEIELYVTGDIERGNVTLKTIILNYSRDSI